MPRASTASNCRFTLPQSPKRSFRRSRRREVRAPKRQTAAAELIAANPDVIGAAGLIDAMPVHALTRTMPIVVIGGPDLIEEGLADSLARPGGNVTRIAILRGELDGKRLELLRELVPAATQVCRTIPHPTIPG